MNDEKEVKANSILNEISEIIYDDNLSDIEALDVIFLVFKKYNVAIESVIDEQKQN